MTCEGFLTKPSPSLLLCSLLNLPVGCPTERRCVQFAADKLMTRLRVGPIGTTGRVQPLLGETYLGCVRNDSLETTAFDRTLVLLPAGAVWASAAYGRHRARTRSADGRGPDVRAGEDLQNHSPVWGLPPWPVLHRRIELAPFHHGLAANKFRGPTGQELRLIPCGSVAQRSPEESLF